jgi:hypothetical protein
VQIDRQGIENMLITSSIRYQHLSIPLEIYFDEMKLIDPIIVPSIQTPNANSHSKFLHLVHQSYHQKKNNG